MESFSGAVIVSGNVRIGCTSKKHANIIVSVTVICQSQAMMVYGLWQTEDQGLGKLKSKTSKLQALKAQLDFRKKIFELIRVSFVFLRTEESYLSMKYAAIFANYFSFLPAVIKKIKKVLLVKKSGDGI